MWCGAGSTGRSLFKNIYSEIIPRLTESTDKFECENLGKMFLSEPEM